MRSVRHRRRLVPVHGDDVLDGLASRRSAIRQARRSSAPATNVCTGNATGETVAKDVAVDCVGRALRSPGAELRLRLADRAEGRHVARRTGSSRSWCSITQGDRNRMVFDDDAGAKRYDAARLDDADLTSVNDAECRFDQALATADGPGWKYYFDHGDPNTALARPSRSTGMDHHIYRSDERVASTTAVEASCSFWNTLQVALPVGAREHLDRLSRELSVQGRQASAHVPVRAASPAPERSACTWTAPSRASSSTKTVVPPQIGKIVAYVASGQVELRPHRSVARRRGALEHLARRVEGRHLAHAVAARSIAETEDCRHWPRDSATPPPGCK